MKYTFKEIRKNVILVEAETQYDLCSMFLRPQEFYESPFENIRGKYFSLEEYMDTYAKENGNFTYYSDWSGFNIPSNVFKKFFETFKYDLTRKEVILLKAISELTNNLEGDFYVIGSIAGNKISLNHEIAHAYWFLYYEYQRKMSEMVFNLDIILSNSALSSLLEIGYSTHFIEDEIQAYLSTTTNRKHLIRLFGWDKIVGVRVPSFFKKYFKRFDESHK